MAEHDEDEAQSVKEFFLKSLQEYGEKVVSLNDRKSINAMKAMTRTLKKSMKCNPNTIHQQLHTFGKGGECQVLDEVFGWGGFRSSYGNDTWTWLIAALDPKWAYI